jgi:hypothetical protein
MSIFVCSHIIVVVHIDGGRLCPWIVATNRLLFIPQVTYEYREQWWNYTDRGKPKTSEKNLSQCHLSTTNPTWSDLGANPSLHNEKPATNHLSHGPSSHLNLSLKVMTALESWSVKLSCHINKIKLQNYQNTMTVDTYLYFSTTDSYIPWPIHVDVTPFILICIDRDISK